MKIELQELKNKIEEIYEENKNGDGWLAWSSLCLWLSQKEHGLCEGGFLKVPPGFPEDGEFPLVLHDCHGHRHRPTPRVPDAVDSGE